MSGSPTHCFLLIPYFRDTMVVSEYEYAQKRNSKFKEFGTTLVIVLALVFELVALFGVNGTDVIAVSGLVIPLFTSHHIL